VAAATMASDTSHANTGAVPFRTQRLRAARPGTPSAAGRLRYRHAEHEDQFGGQDRPHDRDLALVQGQGLERERGDQRHPAEHPQRIAEKVDGQPPA
jgi:hypothetical protein